MEKLEIQIIWTSINSTKINKELNIEIRIFNCGERKKENKERENLIKTNFSQQKVKSESRLIQNSKTYQRIENRQQK